MRYLNLIILQEHLDPRDQLLILIKKHLYSIKSIINNYERYFEKENDLDIFFIDTPNVTQGVESLTARGAAIRGFSQLVKNKFFLLDKNFKLKVNHLKKYIKDNPNKKFIIFGFTSYIFEFLINKLIQKKIKFPKNN